MILLMKMEVRAAALMRKAPPPSSLRSEPSPRLYDYRGNVLCQDYNMKTKQFNPNVFDSSTSTLHQTTRFTKNTTMTEVNRVNRIAYS